MIMWIAIVLAPFIILLIIEETSQFFWKRYMNYSGEKMSKGLSHIYPKITNTVRSSKVNVIIRNIKFINTIKNSKLAEVISKSKIMHLIRRNRKDPSH